MPNPNVDVRVTSPDGHLALVFRLSDKGTAAYTVSLDGRAVLAESRLGLVRADADFSTGLRLASVAPTRTIQDRYQIFTAKRRENSYRANRSEVHLLGANGEPLDVIIQVSNDGVAFRYRFPKAPIEPTLVQRELTSYHFLPETKGWLQPIAVAKSGWARANPSYEEFYSKEIPVGTPSPTKAGWVYPALFRSNDTWIIVSEGSLGRGHCGSRLASDSPEGEYQVAYPDAQETVDGRSNLPRVTKGWMSPWRFVTVGSLATVAESTLGIDLADKPKVAVKRPEPGKAAWSWPLLGDGNTTFAVQKKFVDYAAEMGWRYCLVDALWDTQIGYDQMKELVDYARPLGVQILVWYNSNGSWNDAPQTPRNVLFDRTTRLKEFTRLKQMGVAGLKIDFFGGDGESMIGYYLDLLEDAAKFNFAMNFHGATLPRGWQRTYPHLMTMEAIKGLEYVTFDQRNADEEPTHAAMLPFTRNVFDPMDFTPVVLDKINRINRRTTSGFELALSVLFTSGIQHYAEIPAGMEKAPEFVQQFMKVVPSVWDDSKFIDGYPGKYVVMARKGDKRWFVAGVNGENTERTLRLDLSRLTGAVNGRLITDGESGNLSFKQSEVSLDASKTLTLTVKPHGGFVIEFEATK